MTKFAFLIIGVFFIFGCEDEIHTVSDFYKNDDLYIGFSKKCENGELHREDINCINLLKAKKKREIDKYDNEMNNTSF